MQNGFVKYLSEALNGELPGINAHCRLFPEGRELLPPINEAEKMKHSAILFLIFPENEKFYTCLIKRPASMRYHPGQLAFPGGKVEKGDLSPQMAAIRETEEEVGVGPGSYLIIGKLSDLYIPVSNFIIHPYLAWADRKPDFFANYSEVEDIVLFPLHDFMENEHIEQTQMTTSFGMTNVPYYSCYSEKVWGATAMILSEFFEITKRYQPVRE